MSPFDLHSHSTMSDGTLTPGQLVARAAARGLDVLALTDHDDIGGIAEAQHAAEGTATRVVPGVEISVTWGSRTVHIVGLGVDPACAALAQGLQAIRDGRDARAIRIGAALAKAGVRGAYEGARRFAASDRSISRTHFARFLVGSGHARSTQDAFKRFLKEGRPGHVPHAWASLSDAVSWIHAAGGQAIVAHPGRYGLTSTGLRRLLGEFRDMGGDGLEVFSPSHTLAEAEDCARCARVFGLLASTGSDFHDPEESPLDLGALPPLPVGVVPVWSRW
ncbi:MAG: PHP domain-containing protein [Burkholderiales bacterium]